MLKIYDPWEREAHTFRWTTKENRAHHYASELKKQFGFEQEEEFDQALERALKICGSLAIPVEDNFCQVYRFNNIGLLRDWKLSNLACYLIIVNASPENSNVAKAQVYFARKR